MPLIIPQFDLTQDQAHVIIKFRLPYVKVSKAEFYIEKNKISFYLKPYHLELTFKQPLKETDVPKKCQYDPTNYILECYIEKFNYGEEFLDLQMITNLMQKKKGKQEKKKIKTKCAMIQVVDEKINENDQINDIAEGIKGISLENKIGFNNQYENVFDDLEEELWELSIINPQQTNYENRRKIRDLQIQKEFDKENYLFDLLENEEIDELMESNDEYKHFLESKDFRYTNDEIKILSELPKKEYLIDNQKQILYQLIDIIYSSLYELKIMRGEYSIESAVTINQISSTFSCFSVDDDLEKVLLSCYQRSLCFPLYRSIEICQNVHEQCYLLLKEGKVGVLKLLLNLKQLFKKSEPRYIFNEIYVDDFIIYLQKLNDDILKQMSQEIKGIKIKKSEMIINIIEIEQEALKLIQV